MGFRVGSFYLGRFAKLRDPFRGLWGQMVRASEKNSFGGMIPLAGIWYFGVNHGNPKPLLFQAPIRGRLCMTHKLAWISG